MSAILDGWLSREQLAAELGNVDPKNIPRYERAGLPVIRLGNLRYYDPAAVRAWIASRPRPQRPGRKPRSTRTPPK